MKVLILLLVLLGAGKCNETPKGPTKTTCRSEIHTYGFGGPYGYTNHVRGDCDDPRHYLVILAAPGGATLLCTCPDEQGVEYVTSSGYDVP